MLALLSAASCLDIFVSTHREMLRVVYQILLFKSEDESRYRTFSFLLMLPLREAMANAAVLPSQHHRDGVSPRRADSVAACPCR